MPEAMACVDCSAFAFCQNCPAAARLHTGNEQGISAYQVAVSHGFSGTELQWLASLRGTDGKSFEVNSTGSLADRSNYDNRLPGFSFLDTDAGNLYIRQSSMPGI